MGVPFAWPDRADPSCDSRRLARFANLIQYASERPLFYAAGDRQGPQGFAALQQNYLSIRPYRALASP
jgi:hypothetical protein